MKLIYVFFLFVFTLSFASTDDEFIALTKNSLQDYGFVDDPNIVPMMLRERDPRTPSKKQEKVTNTAAVFGMDLSFSNIMKNLMGFADNYRHSAIRIQLIGDASPENDYAEFAIREYENEFEQPKMTICQLPYDATSCIGDGNIFRNLDGESIFFSQIQVKCENIDESYNLCLAALEEAPNYSINVRCEHMDYILKLEFDQESTVLNIARLCGADGCAETKIQKFKYIKNRVTLILTIFKPKSETFADAHCRPHSKGDLTLNVLNWAFKGRRIPYGIDEESQAKGLTFPVRGIDQKFDTHLRHAMHREGKLYIELGDHHTFYEVNWFNVNVDNKQLDMTIMQPFRALFAENRMREKIKNKFIHYQDNANWALYSMTEPFGDDGTTNTIWMCDVYGCGIVDMSTVEITPKKGFKADIKKNNKYYQTSKTDCDECHILFQAAKNSGNYHEYGVSFVNDITLEFNLVKGADLEGWFLQQNNGKEMQIILSRGNFVSTRTNQYPYYAFHFSELDCTLPNCRERLENSRSRMVSVECAEEETSLPGFIYIKDMSVLDPTKEPGKMERKGSGGRHILLHCYASNYHKSIPKDCRQFGFVTTNPTGDAFLLVREDEQLMCKTSVGANAKSLIKFLDELDFLRNSPVHYERVPDGMTEKEYAQKGNEDVVTNAMTSLETKWMKFMAQADPQESVERRHVSANKEKRSMADLPADEQSQEEDTKDEKKEDLKDNVVESFAHPTVAENVQCVDPDTKPSDLGQTTLVVDISSNPDPCDGEKNFYVHCCDAPMTAGAGPLIHQYATTDIQPPPDFFAGCVNIEEKFQLKAEDLVATYKVTRGKKCHEEAEELSEEIKEEIEVTAEEIGFQAYFEDELLDMTKSAEQVEIIADQPYRTTVHFEEEAMTFGDFENATEVTILGTDPDSNKVYYGFLKEIHCTSDTSVICEQMDMIRNFRFFKTSYLDFIYMGNGLIACHYHFCEDVSEGLYIKSNVKYVKFMGNLWSIIDCPDDLNCGLSYQLPSSMAAMDWKKIEAEDPIPIAKDVADNIRPRVGEDPPLVPIKAGMLEEPLVDTFYAKFPGVSVQENAEKIAAATREAKEEAEKEEELAKKNEAEEKFVAEEKAREEEEVAKKEAEEAEAKEAETKEGETKEGEAEEAETKEGETKEGEAEEAETKGETKEGEAEEAETKEGETKEGEEAAGGEGGTETTPEDKETVGEGKETVGEEGTETTLEEGEKPAEETKVEETPEVKADETPKEEENAGGVVKDEDKQGGETEEKNEEVSEQKPDKDKKEEEEENKETK